MKAISLISYLLLALLMMSCGNKKASVNLSVTSGFSLSAAGYTGGLFVYGKSTDGKSFYATAITGSSVSVPLINGNWTFTVTGWDGAGPFQGSAYCGRTNVVLDSSTTDISIQTNEANCGTTTFTNGISNLADAAFGFRNLRVNTCSSLYTLASGVFSKVTSTSTNAFLSTDYCSAPIGSFSKRFIDRAGSLKIVISGKQTPGMVFPDIATACIPTPNAIHDTSLRIPAHNVPIEIQLFDDSTCSDTEPLIFKFQDGFIAGSDSFDSVVNNQGPVPTYNLFIPFNHLRRGYSSLMDYLPSLKCGVNNCLPQVASVPANYFIYSGDFSSILIPEATSCTAITAMAVAPLGGLAFPANYCEEKDGSVYLKVNDPASNCSSSNCTLTLTITGLAPVVKSFSSNQNFSTERNTYDDIWKIFGNDQAPDRFYRFFEREDESGGILGEIIEEMGPGGLVSIFGDSSCASLNGTKTVSMWDEGQYKTFQVAAQASTLAVPNLICNDNNGNPSASCNTPTFNTQFIYRELINQVWTAKKILHVSCGTGKKIGMIEYQQVKQDGSLIRTEKKIAGWNTTSVGFERVEALVYEKWVHGVSNQIMQAKSGFTRGEVVSSSNFKGQMFGWSSHWNGTDYSEYLLQRDFFSDSASPAKLYSHQKMMDATTSASGNIFNTTSYAHVFNIPFLAYDSYQSKSPNGRIARVWVKHDGIAKRLYITEYDATSTPPSWSSPYPSPNPYPAAAQYISGSGDAGEPRVSVKDNGDIIVAWKEFDGTNWSIQSKSRVSGTWQATLTHSVTVNAGPIGGLDLFIEGDKAAIVWDQLDMVSSQTRIYLSFRATLGLGWHNPTDISAHAISTNGNSSYRPKVAFQPSTLNLIVVYKIGSDILGNAVTLSDSAFPANVSSFSTPVTIDTVISVSEPYLLKLSDRFVLSYKKMSDNSHFSKEYVFASPGWSSGTPENIRFPMEMAYSKTLNLAFDATTPGYAGPNSPISEPSNQNLKGPNNFGLKELKPSVIDTSFTGNASFIAQ